MAAQTVSFCAPRALSNLASSHHREQGVSQSTFNRQQAFLVRRCDCPSSSFQQHSKWQKQTGTYRKALRAAVDQEPKTSEETKKTVEVAKESADEVTKKYGLEAGLWQIFKSKEGEEGKGSVKTRGQQAKDLLAKYGVAYIGTSVFLSLISITVCYLLINSGVDVSSLLNKVGIHTNEQGEQVGAFALAYAAHKALSPVRFPPTVALTPVVANFFGKKADENAPGDK